MERQLYVPKGRRELNNRISIINNDNNNSSNNSSTTQNYNADKQLYVPKGRRDKLTDNNNNDNNVEIVLNSNNSNNDSNNTQISNNSVTQISNNNDSQITNNNDKVKAEIKFYVPKGRRKLNEINEKRKRESEDNNDNSIDYSNNNNNNNNNNIQSPSSSSIFHRTEKMDEIMLKSCALLAIVNNDMSDMARNAILTPILERGAVHSWINNRECLIAFKNESIALTVLSSISKSVNYHFMILNIISSRTDLHDAARLLYNSIKPERDSSVANRLIGAALGIKLPKPRITNTKNTTTEQDEVIDAWD